MTNDKELQLIDLAAWARAFIANRAPDVGGEGHRIWFVAPKNEIVNISIQELRGSGHFMGEALVLSHGGVGDTIPWGTPVNVDGGSLLALVVADYRAA